MLRKLPITLFVIGFVLALPILVPVGIVTHSLYRRRLLRDAASFPCAECKRPLGKASVIRADEEWRQHVAELHRKHPGVKFRLCRTIHAICCHCSFRYTYKEKKRRFVPEVGPTTGCS